MTEPAKRNAAGAPQVLIDIYEQRGAEDGQAVFRNGRSILERLLNDPNMRAAWTALARAGFTDRQYEWLWGEIRLLVLRASRPVQSPAAERDRLIAIADSAMALADQVEGDRQIDLALDKYVGTLLGRPESTHSELSIIGVADVLRELAGAARNAAQNPGKGIAGRVTERESRVRYVALGLVRWMRLPRGGGGRPRHEVVNAIVGAIFPDEPPIDSKKMESRR